jgi:CheY-like chemotaxis protein
MLRRIIGEEIDLQTSLAPDLRNIYADPGQIEQIITNFAVNSKDAMPNGGKLIIETENVELDEEYVKTHPGTEVGSYVMIAVGDSGEGISEEIRSRIFEPFFTTKEIGKGTGLGLSTVYGIVKQSGGNIWFYSELGKGTNFNIYLPAVVETKMPGGNETVLIVDDEESVRSLAVRVLSRLGYKVMEATNGREACLLCEKMDGKFDLIVTDVLMPIMGGIEMAKKLNEKWTDIKILYMSGYSANTIIHEGILDPGFSFLQKPFVQNTIAQKVREILDQ